MPTLAFNTHFWYLKCLYFVTYNANSQALYLGRFNAKIMSMKLKKSIKNLPYKCQNLLKKLTPGLMACKVNTKSFETSNIFWSYQKEK